MEPQTLMQIISLNENGVFADPQFHKLKEVLLAITDVV
jgi:hypothetical protein